MYIHILNASQTRPENYRVLNKFEMFETTQDDVKNGIDSRTNTTSAGSILASRKEYCVE